MSAFGRLPTSPDPRRPSPRLPGGDIAVLRAGFLAHVAGVALERLTRRRAKSELLTLYLPKNLASFNAVGRSSALPTLAPCYSSTVSMQRRSDAFASACVRVRTPSFLNSDSI